MQTSNISSWTYPQFREAWIQIEKPWYHRFWKLLRSANISLADKKLAKETTNELTLVSMKSQLKKIFRHSELTLFEDEAMAQTNAMSHVFPSILALWLSLHVLLLEIKTHWSLDGQDFLLFTLRCNHTLVPWLPWKCMPHLHLTISPCILWNLWYRPITGGLPVAVLDSDIEAHEMFMKWFFFKMI